jgi:hypothetical protein
LVWIHSKAHRATWFAPFEAGGEENLIESLLLGLAFHAVRSRYDECAHSRRDVLSLRDRCRGAKVFDA